VFVERWVDEAALQAHLRLPHTAAFLARLGPLQESAEFIRGARL
jgi:quinol monooxygenase YgiN